ncbi:hypothetical protein Pyn_37397 [Prunus yedoensis var. nudiflora]|uniref:Uncharacterized protein n=1 Tax=Prunus yedoensis var. nudiflora TaxID=2094558 RepID=A0A314UTU0_PRUYE|nr:hypothetical protein Pyn_37397 [Prunus yedoensis var. nudiflora]
MILPPPPRLSLLAASLDTKNAPLAFTLKVLSSPPRSSLPSGYFGSKIPAQIHDNVGLGLEFLLCSVEEMLYAARDLRRRLELQWLWTGYFRNC